MGKKKEFKELKEKDIQQRLYGEYTLIDFYKTTKHKIDVPHHHDTKEDKERKKHLRKEIGEIKHEIEDAKKAIEKMKREKANLNHEQAVDSPLGFPPMDFTVIANLIHGIRKNYKAIILILAIGALLFFTPKIFKSFKGSDGANIPGAPEVRYVVQVAEVESIPDANRLMDSLKGKGFDVDLFATVSKKGIPRYRVYVGSYKKYSGAKPLLNKLKTKENFTDAFIRKR